MKTKTSIAILLVIVALPLFSKAQVIIDTNSSSGGGTTYTPSGSGTVNIPNNSTAPAEVNIPNNSTPPAEVNIPNNSKPPAEVNITQGGSNTFYLQNPLSSKFNSVGGLVQGFLEIFSYIVALFAVLMLIWVGLQFVLAQGNPGKMQELKDWLLWIVVGVAIVIGARIIVSIVLNTLSTTGTVSPSVIQNANNALNGVSPRGN